MHFEFSGISSCSFSSCILLPSCIFLSNQLQTSHLVSIFIQILLIFFKSCSCIGQKSFQDDFSISHLWLGGLRRGFWCIFEWFCLSLRANHHQSMKWKCRGLLFCTFLRKEIATHSSILAWRIPWTEEPGGLQSTGSHRVGHDWATSHTHAHCVLKWWPVHTFAAASAKLLQSCPTLCNPIDNSPPGSPVPGILQSRTTGVGCHFLLQCMKVKSESEVA